MKTKVHYLVEWRAVYPEVSWEFAGKFTDHAKAMKKVNDLTKDGEEVRLIKITTDVMIFKPKA